jgi:hypothetical protein
MQGRREHNQSWIEFPVGPFAACGSLVRKSAWPLALVRTLAHDNVRIMRNYKHPLGALERLDLKWERGVRDLYLPDGGNDRAR